MSCYFCSREVKQGLEHEAYEVRINKWTNDHPKVVEHLFIHDHCWQNFKLDQHTNSGHKTTMSDWFGDFIEPQN